MAPTARWFEEAFRADYRRVYPHRDLESARPEVRWLVDRGLRGRVLDLCCGFGRHALLMAEAGLDVLGLDLSIDLLRAARELPAYERRLAGRLVRGDARELPFRAGAFDGVACLFSSFGYFGERDDARVLDEIARVLAPGGACFLDLMNPDFVRANLAPQSAREGDAYVVRERRALAEGGRRVVKEVELAIAGEVRRWREDVRLYAADEVRALCAARGLDVLDFSGAFDGSAFGRASPRMLVRARRR